MSRIFITGDTHGNIDFGKLSAKEWQEGRTLNKNDYLIIAGDAGIVWYGGKKDNYLKAWYDGKPWTTLFIDGNHENHHALNLYPEEEWNGGRAHRISDSVLHLMRGEYYDIDGRTFWVMGGADSTDKMYRRRGVSWWEEELPSGEELEYGLRNLEKHGMTVDYVVTHDCAASLQQILYGCIRNPSGMTGFFDRLEFDYGLKFKCWYFGHHHKDIALDEKHICLYEDIVDIDLGKKPVPGRGPL